MALSSRHAALFIPEDAPQPALRTLAEAVPRVPAAWRALSPHGEFRPSQEDTLEAIASGRDVVSRQPTGSGKSLCAQLPALAEWCADWRARVDLASEEARDALGLPRMTLLLVPWVALGMDQEREATELFIDAFNQGRTPAMAQARQTLMQA